VLLASSYSYTSTYFKSTEVYCFSTAHYTISSAKSNLNYSEKQIFDRYIPGDVVIIAVVAFTFVKINGSTRTRNMTMITEPLFDATMKRLIDTERKIEGLFSFLFRRQTSRKID
jgi:hypothetical protein